MALADFQFSLGGVTFGHGTVYGLHSVTGLGLGGKREKVFAKPGADGVEWGRERRDGPTITFEGTIDCPDAAAAYAAMLTLRAAFNGSTRTSPRTTQPLGMKWPGQAEASVLGRPDRFDPVLDDIIFGRIPFSATFVAAAPLAV